MADDDAADRVAGAERADHPEIAGSEIGAVLVEGDDRAGRTGVGVLVEDGRRLVVGRQSRPSTPLAISWFIFRFAWCSQKRRTSAASNPHASRCAVMCAATIGHTSRKTLLAVLPEDQLVRLPPAVLANC